MRSLLVALFLLGLTISASAQDSVTYIPSPQTNTIIVLDTTEASIVSTIALDAAPQALVHDVTSETLYVITQADNQLLVLHDNEIIEALPLKSAPSAIILDNAANQLTISFSDDRPALVVDATTLKEITTATTAITTEPTDELLLPASPLCPLQAAANRATFQTNLPPGIIDLQCRVLAENGSFIQPAAEIGVQDVLDMNILHAVELFSPSGINVSQVDVCLLGQGDLIYLDAEAQPRAPEYLRSHRRADYTCATLPGLGTLILVN